ncbi:MAG TPA: hypothetical protein PKI60_00505 [Oscillospiraceae bacterium]|nr:hypothetical protein [Oscillospiraceae bacterium]
MNDLNKSFETIEKETTAPKAEASGQDTTNERTFGKLKDSWENWKSSI